MKVDGLRPAGPRCCLRLLGGVVAGLRQRAASRSRFGLPAFVATLGMFYIARGLAAWLVAGRAAHRLPGELQSDRPQADRGRCATSASRRRPARSCSTSPAALSVQSILMVLVAIVAGVVLGYTDLGPAGLRHRRQSSAPPTMPASTPTGCASSSLVFCVALRRLRRAHLHRLSSAASTRSPGSSASSTPSPR